jgi:hypothetical protein
VSTTARRSRTPARGGPSRVSGGLVALVLVVGGAYAWSQFTGSAVSPALRVPADTSSDGRSRPFTASPPRYTCDGRIHCSQMHSCEEATFFLQNCRGVKMDGDGDGVPCEEQWCGHR